MGNMKGMIVRGLPPKVRFKIKRMARAENLSMNQIVIRLLLDAIEKSERENEREASRAEAFRRIGEIREEIRRKYGIQEDSTKIIREMREERTRRIMGE